MLRSTDKNSFNETKNDRFISVIIRIYGLSPP